MDVTIYHLVIPPIIAIISGGGALALLRSVRAEDTNASARANTNVPMQDETVPVAVTTGAAAQQVQEKVAAMQNGAAAGDALGILEREKILIKRIAADPRDVEAYQLLGEVYLVQNNLSDAAECFAQVTVLDPQNLRAVEQLNKIKKIRAAQSGERAE